ncbi:MAG: hypothetical protein WCY25_07745 [Moheibacter sp.]
MTCTSIKVRCNRYFNLLSMTCTSIKVRCNRYFNLLSMTEVQYMIRQKNSVISDGVLY